MHVCVHSSFSNCIKLLYLLGSLPPYASYDGHFLRAALGILRCGFAHHTIVRSGYLLIYKMLKKMIDVCMYVCMYVYNWCTCIYMKSMYLSMRMYVGVNLNMCIYNVCVCFAYDICMYVCMYVCIYMLMWNVWTAMKGMERKGVVNLQQQLASMVPAKPKESDEDSNEQSTTSQTTRWKIIILVNTSWIHTYIHTYIHTKYSTLIEPVPYRTSTH